MLVQERDRERQLDILLGAGDAIDSTGEALHLVEAEGGDKFNNRNGSGEEEGRAGYTAGVSPEMSARG